MDNQPKRSANHIPIWDIPILYHPSILCCCLNEQDQKTLCPGSDIQKVHNQCNVERINKILQFSSMEVDKSKMLQNILDYKFNYQLNAVSKIGIASQLKDLWNTHFFSGEYQGAYWAIMSHRLCDDRLRHFMHKQVKINCLQKGCLYSRQKRQKGVLEKQMTCLREHFEENEKKHKQERLQYCKTIGLLRKKLTIAEFEIDQRER